ncbi:MAG: phage terminase large subunit family protein [Synergistaceae bacterium]|nr:phage terminase large subunit family protein [Synergistaceae bacterium]
MPKNEKNYTEPQPSNIYKDFELSSKEEWGVPCPTCGEFNASSWEQIKYKGWIIVNKVDRNR